MDFLVKIFAQNQKAALCLTGTAVALLGLALGYKYTRRRRKFTQVGVVSQLLLHPLKSGKAVCVSAAECQRIGLRCGDLRDRHWLVITEDGHMVTGRQQPRLVLVSLTCEGGQVCLNAPGIEEFKFPLHQPTNPILKCRVFSSDTEGRDCGDEVSNWFTRFLAEDKTFRLVHFEPQLKARVPPEKGFPKDEKVVYQDTAPVMLMSESSLDDLNSRLNNGTSMCQFRPSIVASDCEPFSEDSWDHVQIGEVEMQRVMGCGRCILTTVDPETGVITRKEPLDTLRT
ncbi:mitochondrial amidoxime-reducing component 1-like, partial [Clarias magur]